MAIAYLSSPHGQEIQQRAYDEIMKVYPDGDAWEKCLIEEKVPYITAFVKEVLRFWTVIPICLPRKSIKEIQWEGTIIPAGTTFYMVCTPLAPHASAQDHLTGVPERLRSQLRPHSLHLAPLLRPLSLPLTHNFLFLLH